MASIENSAGIVPHFLDLISSFERDARNLVGLTALGLAPDKSSAGWLWKDFRELGLLHLLVLSGSQIGVLKNACDVLARVLFRSIIGSRPCPVFWLRACWWVVGTAYVWAVGWSPPLSRAWIVSLADEPSAGTWSRLRRLPWLCLAHAALFPDQVGTISFGLSWLSFVTLQVGQSLGWARPWPAVLVTVVCQTTALIWLDLPWPGVATWALWMIANLALGVLFEAVLLPLAGICLLGIAFACSVPVIDLRPVVMELLSTVIAPPLEGAASAVLVGLRALMYIFR